MIKGIIRDFHVEPLGELFDRDIEAPLSSGKIISLIGVRRSGKTSLLLNSVGKLKRQGIDMKNILYLNFEDERLELRGIIDACRKFGLKQGIIITSSASEDFEVEKIRIQTIPLYRWLLSDEQ